MEIDLLDIFVGPTPLSGNPLAVVRGGALDTMAMQGLSDWLGFSETTFLVPPTDPGADYGLRIFCPGRELPFAGHPTLGSAFAWLQAGGRPRRDDLVVQQCGIGLVPVRIAGEQLAFAAPPLLREGPLSEAERTAAARATGVEPEWIADAVHVANGPGWVLLRLHSAAQVLAAKPAPTAPPLTTVGLVGSHPPHEGVDWEVRGFFTDARGQLIEDPVTGSLNAGIACYLFAHGLATAPYIAAQGQSLGRGGRVVVSRDAEGIWVGGRVTLVAHGGALNAAKIA